MTMPNDEEQPALLEFKFQPNLPGIDALVCPRATGHTGLHNADPASGEGRQW
jgi:hypothetical protein